MRLKILYTLSFLLVIAIFYLSWVPSPRLTLLDFIPDGVARWADEEQNDNIRTAIPLALLGFVTGCYIVLTHRAWYTWLITWLVLIGIVLIAELGQLSLPHRHFDWGDIGWGTAGALGGMLPASGLLLVGATSKRSSRSQTV